MCNEYGKSRARLLSCVAVLGLSASVSACSSGLSRIDQMGIADSVSAPGAVQQGSVSQVASQPLPAVLDQAGNAVDNTYTSSVGATRYQRSVQPQSAALLGGLRPKAIVAGVQPVTQVQPINGYPAAPYPYQPNSAALPQQISLSSAPQNLAPAMPAKHAPMALDVAAASVERQPLSSLSARPLAQSTSFMQSASPAKTADRLSVGFDQMTTSSVAKTGPSVVASAMAPGNWNGWTAAGGTAIDVHAGETVYNLSRRYGVPPQAILGVNGLSDASQLRRGSKIVIPVYQFSRQTGVSAPDASAKVQAASSSTGYANKLPEQIAVPRQAPQEVSNIVTSGVLSNQKPVAIGEAVVKPQPLPAPIVAQKVASAGGYNVVAGDTLYSVARRHKVSVQSLMQVNALQSSNLRIGQSLQIPASGQIPTSGMAPVTAAKAAPAPQKPAAVQVPAQVAPVAATVPVKGKDVDPITTASTPPLPKPTASGISTLRWPVRGRVVNGFGDVVAGKRNNGIDIVVPEGTGVKAAENGVVLYAGDELAGYGNLVLLKHANGIVTAYAHNSSIKVRRGQKVARGETIARAGKSGNADTPRVHFEVRKDSVPVNPIRYLGG